MYDPVAFWKYAGVFLTLIGAGFGLPIPEEIPIVTAGAMVGHDSQEVLHAGPLGALGGGPAAAYYRADAEEGRAHWYYMLPACILGVVLGDTVLYGAGRLFGRRLLDNGWVRRNVLPPEKRAKIEENFRTRGVMILLGARFTPGIRSPVFIMSGVLKLPLTHFVIADALYAIPGVNILFWLSYVFTDQFVAVVQGVEHQVDRYRPLIIVAVVAAVLGILAYRYITTRQLSTGDPAKIPGYARPVGAAALAVEHVVEKAVGVAAEKTKVALDMAVEKTVEKTKDVYEKVTHRGVEKHQEPGTKSETIEPHIPKSEAQG